MFKVELEGGTVYELLDRIEETYGSLVAAVKLPDSQSDKPMEDWQRRSLWEVYTQVVGAARKGDSEYRQKFTESVIGERKSWSDGGGVTYAEADRMIDFLSALVEWAS